MLVKSRQSPIRAPLQSRSPSTKAVFCASATLLHLRVFAVWVYFLFVLENESIAKERVYRESRESLRRYSHITTLYNLRITSAMSRNCRLNGRPQAKDVVLSSLMNIPLRCPLALGLSSGRAPVVFGCGKDKGVIIKLLFKYGCCKILGVL